MINVKEFFTFAEATELINNTVERFTQNDLLLLAAQYHFPLYFYYSGFLGVMSDNDYLSRVSVVSKRIPFGGIVKPNSFDYETATTRGTNLVFDVTPEKWFRHNDKSERLTKEIEQFGEDYFVVMVDFHNEVIFPEIPLTSFLIAAKDLESLLQQRPAQNAIEKPLTAIERTTLLTIIATLCGHSGIEIKDHGAASKIAKLTEKFGAPVSDDAIRKALVKIPNAVESRKK